MSYVFLTHDKNTGQLVGMGGVPVPFGVPNTWGPKLPDTNPLPWEWEYPKPFEPPVPKMPKPFDLPYDPLRPGLPWADPNPYVRPLTPDDSFYKKAPTVPNPFPIVKKRDAKDITKSIIDEIEELRKQATKKPVTKADSLDKKIEELQKKAKELGLEIIDINVEEIKEYFVTGMTSASTLTKSVDPTMVAINGTEGPFPKPDLLNSTQMYADAWNKHVGSPRAEVISGIEKIFGIKPDSIPKQSLDEGCTGPMS